MSISVDLQAVLTVVETLSGSRPFAVDAKARVTHDQLNIEKTLGAGTTPPATKVAAFQKALSAGAATIDLAALVGTNGAALDGTGLRVQAILLKNPATNANAITVAIGASNGYDGLGADFSITLQPDAHALIFANNSGGYIGPTKKTLDLSGTLAQVLDVIIVMG